MATAIATPKAGTDKDARLIKNRPLNIRQLKALRTVVATEGAGITPAVFGSSLSGELYATDKARRTLTQLQNRGCVKQRANGTFTATAKGRKLASK